MTFTSKALASGRPRRFSRFTAPGNPALQRLATSPDLQQAQMTARTSIAKVEMRRSRRPGGGTPGAANSTVGSEPLGGSNDFGSYYGYQRSEEGVFASETASGRGASLEADTAGGSTDVEEWGGGPDPETPHTHERSHALKAGWLAFVKQPAFSNCIVVVISLNLLCLALETDYPQWPWWFVLNTIFFLIYIVEYVLRAAQVATRSELVLKSSIRSNMDWLSYDFVVITVGAVDLAVALVAAPHALFGYQLPRFFAVDSNWARFLRLTRIMRVLRILRINAALHSFGKVLVAMFVETIGWIFTVIFLFLFVLAIILTRMIGHGLVVDVSKPNAREVRSMFKDIPTSLFTLFRLTTADDWGEIAVPVVSLDQPGYQRFAWRIFFVFFITFMSWTMLSLLTAVASEMMIIDNSVKKDDILLEKERDSQDFVSFLCEQFLEADEDGNGALDRDEFQTFMTRPSMKAQMRARDLMLEDRDIDLCWETFDHHATGLLEIMDLVDGFALLQEGLATKHVAEIGYYLKHFGRKCDQTMNTLEADMDKMIEKQDEVLRHVHRQQQLYQEQWSKFILNQRDAAASLHLKRPVPQHPQHSSPPHAPPHGPHHHPPGFGEATPGTIVRTIL